MWKERLMMKVINNIFCHKLSAECFFPRAIFCIKTLFEACSASIATSATDLIGIYESDKYPYRAC